MPKRAKRNEPKGFPKHDILNYFMVDLLEELEHATKEIDVRGKPIALEAKATTAAIPSIENLSWLAVRVQAFLEDIQEESAPHLSIGRPRINFTMDDLGGKYVSVKVIADHVH